MQKAVSADSVYRFNSLHMSPQENSSAVLAIVSDAKEFLASSSLPRKPRARCPSSSSESEHGIALRRLPSLTVEKFTATTQQVLQDLSTAKESASREPSAGSTCSRRRHRHRQRLSDASSAPSLGSYADVEPVTPANISTKRTKDTPEKLERKSAPSQPLSARSSSSCTFEGKQSGLQRATPGGRPPLPRKQPLAAKQQTTKYSASFQVVGVTEQPEKHPAGPSILDLLTESVRTISKQVEHIADAETVSNGSVTETYSLPLDSDRSDQNNTEMPMKLARSGNDRIPCLSCTKAAEGVVALCVNNIDVYGQPMLLAQAASDCQSGAASESNRAVNATSCLWVRGEMLGRGAFGNVFKAVNRQSGKVFAVKEVQIDQRDAADVRFREALENEIELMRAIQHSNIVSYLGHDYIHSILHIYLEFMPGGSLANALFQFGPFAESLIAVYSRQLCEGLEYLHTREPIVLHRDIKSANILIGPDCQLKLADFGCSKRTHDTMSQSLRGSIPWMAPEVITQSGYGRRSDVWSLGCVIIEMATAKSPWPNFNNTMAAAMHIGTDGNVPECPESLSGAGQNFIRQCTIRDKNERPLATALLRHEFLQVS
eukprot:TRINITY_DN102516_c0_g1_i1.p1 TRINITY_DN102516_c0_g1~~TRINITY_DN102516_c0_g1_i1.p1  ORF type:complete len:629 (+),score=75.76 TRINITY_DN102516_c0_g1_i1:87-1889(+)